MGVNGLYSKKKNYLTIRRGLVTTKFLLSETEGSARVRVQLGPAVGCLMTLPVNDRERMGYPTASSPKEFSALFAWA
jgi:hypothetical protein